jgi:hypothetical protein
VSDPTTHKTANGDGPKTGEPDRAESPIAVIPKVVGRLKAAVFRVLYAIRSSFFAFFAAMGILLVIWGFLHGRGELAGILGVLGAMAILYGLIGRLALKFIGY